MVSKEFWRIAKQFICSAILLCTPSIGAYLSMKVKEFLDL